MLRKTTTSTVNQSKAQPKLLQLYHISITHASWWVSLVAQMVKNLPATRETWDQPLGQEDPPGKGHGNPLQYSYLENSMDRGDWWATVHEVTKSRT